MSKLKKDAELAVNTLEPRDFRSFQICCDDLIHGRINTSMFRDRIVFFARNASTETIRRIAYRLQ